MSSEIQSKFQAAGQGHVFQYFDSVTATEQSSLIAQAEAIDLTELQELIDTLVLSSDSHSAGFDDMNPAPFTPLPQNGGDPKIWEKAKSVGEEEGMLRFRSRRLTRSWRGSKRSIRGSQPRSGLTEVCSMVFREP